MKSAAGVIVFCGKNVLLAKRSMFFGREQTPMPLAGYWSCFAGSMEEGESPMMCATRELMEESKIHAEISDIIYINSILTETLSLHLYALELKEMITPQLDEEHTESGWFQISSLNCFPEKIDQKIVDSILLYENYRYIP